MAKIITQMSTSTHVTGNGAIVVPPGTILLVEKDKYFHVSIVLSVPEGYQLSAEDAKDYRLAQPGDEIEIQNYIPPRQNGGCGR